MKIKPFGLLGDLFVRRSVIGSTKDFKDFKDLKVFKVFKVLKDLKLGALPFGVAVIAMSEAKKQSGKK